MIKSLRARHPGPHTAIVVGSGCSVGLGIPPLAGFLDILMDKLGKDDAYTGAKDDLAAIQTFITRVKGAAAYVKADLLNIEELYGMADMDEDLWKAAGRPPAEEWYGFKPRTPGNLNPMRVKQALNRAIFFLAKSAGEEFLTQHDRFPRNRRELEEVKRESATETPVHRNQGTRWTNLMAYLCLASFQDRNARYPLFIQFNWDLALDRALCLWARLRGGKRLDCSSVKLWLPWYGAEADGQMDHDEWPRLARPHGGINWINAEPQDEPLSATYGPIKELFWKSGREPDTNEIRERCFQIYHSGTRSDIWIDTAPVYQKSPPDAAWRHGDYMEIVPPTWRKQATKPAYEAQWGHISQGLEGVRRIIFIGYSLPKTDLYFRHFLALSLADNPHLPKVYVLNPSIMEPGEVRDNYLDLFAPLAREGRLFGIPGRFGDPALYDLHRAMNLAKEIKPQ